MAHNIMNKSKFVTLRQPAWHGLGLVTNTELSAMEAFRKIGEVVIRTEPVVTASGLPTDHKAIISETVENNTVQTNVVSVVSADYNEITHADFCNAWDNATARYIETLGILGKGETLFITTKLPTFDVKGDETHNYLLAYSPLSGIESVTLRITPVRVVCQNTLILSGSQCSAQYRVIHTSDMARSVEKFLHNVWSEIEFKAKAVQEALTILSSHRLLDPVAKSVLSVVYPEPVKPEADPHTNEGLTKLAVWEKSAQKMLEHQGNVFNLWQGTGTGMDMESCAGTSYGLYNAIVEYEDHTKAHRRASSAVFGAGADRKMLAHSTLMQLATA